MAKAIMGIPADKLVGAIRKLETMKTGQYAGRKGVHTVFDGLNTELRRKGVSDVRAFWTAAETAKIVQTRGAKGGPIVYVFGERPVSEPSQNGKALGTLD